MRLTAHRFPAGVVAALWVAVVLCGLGFLFLLGEGLATVFGRYATTSMYLIGP
jgi:hypothetical protein